MAYISVYFWIREAGLDLLDFRQPVGLAGFPSLNLEKQGVGFGGVGSLAGGTNTPKFFDGFLCLDLSGDLLGSGFGLIRVQPHHFVPNQGELGSGAETLNSFCYELVVHAAISIRVIKDLAGVTANVG